MRWDDSVYEEKPSLRDYLDRYRLDRSKGRVAVVTLDNFAAFFLSNPSAVLYIHAPWSEGRAHMEMRLRQLSEMFPRTSFGMMDADAEVNWNAVRAMGIKGLPSVVFFSRGARKRTEQGVRSLSFLSKLVRSYEKETAKIEGIRDRIRAKQRRDLEERYRRQTAYG